MVMSFGNYNEWCKKQKCLYCNLPVEIQRNPFNRDYSAKWPLYALIGVPNMMSDLINGELPNMRLIHGIKQKTEIQLNLYGTYCIQQKNENFISLCVVILININTVF